MTNLPKSGVDLTAQGASGFLGDMSKAFKASQDFFQGTQTGARDASTAYAKLQESADKSLDRILTLTNRLDLQKRSYEALQADLAKTAAKFGDASEQADKKRLALDKLGNQIAETERALDRERVALSRTQEEMERGESAAAKLGRAFKTGAEGMEVVTDVAKKIGTTAAKYLGDFADKMDDGAKRAGAFGEIVTGALRRIGEIGVDALLDAGRAVGEFTTNFIGDALSSAGDVEQTLNVLQVAGGATEAQMAQLSRRAVELGSDLTLPATSAQDASVAMLELVKSGFDVDKAMGAAKGTLQLAAAAETDAATAAKLMSGALNAFQLSAQDATHITDLLAGAANASQASITDLSQGFNQAGFAFHLVGASADDLAVSLAVLTKNGLTGSDSGTALKNAIMRLINPTDKAKGVMKSLGFAAYDAQGVMKPWPQIIEELRQATQGLTDEQKNEALGTIFLSDGLKAMTPLLSLTQSELAGMYKEVTASGQAADLAGAQMKGWNGVVAGFQSQMETLALIIGNHLLPVVTPLGQKLAEAVGALTQGDYTGFFTKITEVLQEVLARVTRFFQELGAGQSILSPFLDSLAKSLGPIGKMLIDTAGGWFKNLTDWIIKEAPPFLKPIGDMLLVEADKWLKSLLVWVDTQVPVLLENLKKWADQFVAWIEPQIPVLLEKLNPLIARLETWLDDQVPKIQAKLEEWAGLFGEWLVKDAGPKLIAGAWDMWMKLMFWLADRSEELYRAGQNWIGGLLLGIGRGILDLPMTLANLMTHLVGGIRDGIGWVAHNGGELGRALIDGFGRAIQDGVGWIVDQARNMAQAAFNEAKRVLGIGSPSKAFMQLGLYTDQGFAQGLKQGTPMVQQSMQQMVAPPALPMMGGATSIDNSRTVNYGPTYGTAVQPNQQRDTAFARSMASW